MVEIGRNTPLTLVFVFFVFILPGDRDHPAPGPVPAIIALTVYTSAFVCEAVRSGINSRGDRSGGGRARDRSGQHRRRCA